eukprot:m.10879 g.10879  ORF g.10879 m.10879 type:complete len:219 (+) comp6270_c0_seq1:152-808(+)
MRSIVMAITSGPPLVQMELALRAAQLLIGVVILYIAVTHKIGDKAPLMEYMENIGPSHVFIHAFALFLTIYSLTSKYVFKLEPKDFHVMMKDLLACGLLLAITTALAASWADLVERFELSPSRVFETFIGINYLQFYLFVTTAYLGYKGMQNTAEQAVLRAEERELIGDDLSDLEDDENDFEDDISDGGSEGSAGSQDESEEENFDDEGSDYSGSDRS